MKKRKIKLVLAFFAFIILFFSVFNTANILPQTSNGNNSFLIGSMTSGFNAIKESGDPYYWDQHINIYKNYFGFNSCIFYAGNPQYFQYGYDGGLYEPLNNYKAHVNEFMSFFSDKLAGIYGRWTITRLCGAQRSTYEAEDESPTGYGFLNDINPTGVKFYNDEFGASGRRCITGTHNQGYMVSHLVENMEQSENHGAGYYDVVSFDDSLWYVKPRMRIKPEDVINHPNELVARIEIYSFDGNIAKSVNIKCKNFGGSYNGAYIEEYQNVGLTIYGSEDELNHGAYAYYNGETYTTEHSKLDYRIYWYGNIDVWVDYVRVDDQWAHNLFGNTLTGDFYRNKINAEASEFSKIIGTENESYKFYVDEIRYNNIPAINCVNSLVKTASNNKLSIECVSYPAINGSLRNRKYDASEFLDKTNSDILMYDLYTLNYDYPRNDPNNPYYEGRNSFVPPNLPPVYEPVLENVIYNNPSYNKYTGKIQTENFGDQSRNSDATVSYFNLSLVSCLNKMAINAKAKGIRHMPVLQVHSWIFTDQNGVLNNPGTREPTVEEIKAQSNLALCYGAKGIFYFFYLTRGYDYVPPLSKGLNLQSPLEDNSQLKFIGLTQVPPGSPVAEPIYTNTYGQNKYYGVSSEVSFINNIGPTLMKLDWDESFSVHHDGGSHKFISDIRSKLFYQSNGFDPCVTDNVKYDCPEERYWEMGFFNLSSIFPNSEKSKYFFMVNRRTVPDNPAGTGDLRFLFIKFNSNLLEENNWRLTDVNTGQYIEFINSSTEYIDLGSQLGLFQPGEGKLFKLEPIPQSGGTLACDEYINGGTFDVKDTIYTNGHTLRIGYGTTLNFSDSACIVVNGGSLICGDINQPTHARDIIFKGNNGNWSGVVLNNCDTVNINSVQFQNVKGGQNDNNYVLKLINCNLVNINNCSFTNSDPQLSGSIEATFATSLFVIPNINISGNTFTGNSSDKTAISIIANAQSNIPVIIDNNYFSSASNAATAMFLYFIGYPDNLFTLSKLSQSF